MRNEHRCGAPADCRTDSVRIIHPEATQGDRTERPRTNDGSVASRELIALTDGKGRLLWARQSAPDVPRRSRPAVMTGSPSGCGRPRSPRRPGIHRARRQRSRRRSGGDHRLKGRPEPAADAREKLSNKALAAVRAPVEPGFAHLKNRRVSGRTLSPYDLTPSTRWHPSRRHGSS